MKKFLALAIIILTVFFLVSFAFAQQVKIIDIQGEVSVKEKPSLDWQRAKLSMLLDKDAEIKTGPNSECTLAFNEDLTNVIAIIEKSTLKIESILPGKVYLSLGRVFALIEGTSQAEEFQVRTPTAIAGARGTGWITFFGPTGTLVLCFDDIVHILGLDQQGNITGEGDLSEGYGMNVNENGILGDIYALAGADFRDWNDFISNLEDLIRSLQNEGGNGSGSFGDLRYEQRSDYQESGLEQRREEEEEARQEREGQGQDGHYRE